MTRTLIIIIVTIILIILSLPFLNKANHYLKQKTHRAEKAGKTAIKVFNEDDKKEDSKKK
jgi:competence protein ComGC